MNEGAGVSSMDLRKKYFYITINFSPNYNHVFKCIDGDIYINTLTGEQFRKRLLYDFGWGQETGFEKFPPLTFDELIVLVENSVTIKKKRIWEKCSQEERRNNDISQNNLFGAISVIMQDHVEEFIRFLSDKINTDYFSNEIIRKNYMWFSLSTPKMHAIGRIPGGIRTKSYEEVLNEYEQWRKISKIVVEQVYR